MLDQVDELVVRDHSPTASEALRGNVNRETGIQDRPQL
jgi:hypothetical protein